MQCFGASRTPSLPAVTDSNVLPVCTFSRDWIYGPEIPL
jgi:hypothetical protein